MHDIAADDPFCELLTGSSASRCLMSPLLQASMIHRLAEVSRRRIGTCVIVGALDFARTARSCYMRIQKCQAGISAG